jgi:hypothetical protein
VLQFRVVAFVLALLLMLTFAGWAQAQQRDRPGGPPRPTPPPGQQQPPPGSEAGACAACGVVAFVWIAIMLFVLVLVGVQIFVAIWIFKDAKARGVDNPAIWLLLSLFAGWIGIVIYFVTRPPGILQPCPACGQKRLEGSRRCPHCGSA